MNITDIQVPIPTVIYHRSDYDGLFSLAVARLFLGDMANYIGWDHGDAKIDFPATGPVYVIDLSPDVFHKLIATDVPRLIWIDHHKTSIDKWSFEKCGRIIPGYRIDGVAACRLAYQWFTTPVSLPVLEDYKQRRVSEPYALTLAGEYDIFDHVPSNHLDVTFQFGLDSVNFIDWKVLMLGGLEGKYEVDEILRIGGYAQQCYRNRDAQIMQHRSFRATFEGRKFLCLNTARCNSHTFAALDLPDAAHEALLAFYWNGDCWTVSLYHSQHHTDIDLSPIAVKWGREVNPKTGKPFGGGGHPGACGFQASWLPFLQDDF